jgi:hypothetical protein
MAVDGFAGPVKPVASMVAGVARLTKRKNGGLSGEKKFI